MAGYQRFATSYGVYKVKKIGNTWWVLTPDGSKFPYDSRAAALGHFAGYKKKAKANSTKAQRRANASKRSKQKRISRALQKFLKASNPAGKFAGAKIRRNKGSITIIPIKLRRASR